MKKILRKIWPLSEIISLHEQLQLEREFSELLEKELDSYNLNWRGRMMIRQQIELMANDPRHNAILTGIEVPR